MQSLAENQSFLDGNKRIAWICGKLFLALHGRNLQVSDAEGAELFLKRLPTGMSVPDLAAWIEAHLD